MTDRSDVNRSDVNDPNGPDAAGPASKEPGDWTTGDEPMTGPQKSYLHTLAQQAGQEPPPDMLSKAEASRRIDDLQERTGRGS